MKLRWWVLRLGVGVVGATGYLVAYTGDGKDAQYAVVDAWVCCAVCCLHRVAYWLHKSTASTLHRPTALLVWPGPG